MSDLLEVTDEIVALSNRAVDERDAARAEAAELRELAATCGAIAAECFVENDRLKRGVRDAVKFIGDGVVANPPTQRDIAGMSLLARLALLLRDS